MVDASLEPTEPAPDCAPGEHTPTSGRLVPSPAALERAARLFRALADENRLRLLARLASGEHCVSELAEAEGEALSTISRRLRILRDEHLIVQRREGRPVTVHPFHSSANRRLAWPTM
jgi:ArsR family transcriptional regulator, lead/cadmium/zinc/bismuth-responsive transcriptional repressor